MNPYQYLIDNNLWDLERLKQHAQENSVYVIESSRFPGLVMLHYMDIVQYDNLWNTFNRMCRGLIINLSEKKIVAYPFEKFFNLNQVPETSYETLKSLGKFQTTEKLDGSMCVLFRVPSTGEYRLTTKGSFDSEHGEYATSLLSNNLKKSKWVEEYTLMFELIAKQFQIVVNYDKKGYKPGLYLIGARERATNRLLSYAEIVLLATELGLPCVKTYSFESLDDLIETSQNLSVLEEGFVLRWEPELLVKVKGPKYLEMHRFISNLSDKNILEAVANNTADVLVPLCPEEYKIDVEYKIKHFKQAIANLQEICYTKYKDAPKSTRKDFALWVTQNVESHLKGFLFQAFDSKPLERRQLCRVVGELEHVSGKTKI